MVVLAFGVTFLALAAALRDSGGLRDALLATGATLTTTPIVTALLRYFTGDPVEDLTREIGRISRVSREASRSGVLGIYHERADIATGRFEELCDKSRDRVAILAYAMEFLADSSTFLDTLGNRATAGVSVRVLLGDPEGHSIRMRDEEERNEGSIPSRIDTTLLRAQNELGRPGCSVHSTIRLFDAPLYASIYLFDDEMIVCPALYATRGSRAPALVLTTGPLLDSYLNHFDEIWGSAKPLDM